MNTLPKEIIEPLVCKVNARTCKLWLNIWYTKPVNILLCGCSVYAFTKFTNIITLELGSRTVVAPDVTLPVTLKKLILHQNKYVTATMMYALTNLTELHFGGDIQITNTVLREIMSVTTLKMADNNTISEDSLSHLSNLKCLSIENCKGITDACLEKMTNLEALALDEMPHLMCQTLTKMTNLTSIRFYKFYINDDVLTRMTQLEKLEFYERPNSISHNAITHLTNLTVLAIFNQVDITRGDVARLKKLKEIHFVSDGFYGKQVYCRYITQLL